MKRITIFLFVAVTFWGCSTDLDINAPYKNITVVYGLLNMRDTAHYIKVNKAYLGDGDAYIYAQIADSNEWADGAISDAKVFRILNGNRIDSFPLQPTEVTDREPGIFYAPNQRLYYFQDPFTEQVLQNGVPITFHLDQNSEYELQMTIKGERVTGRTNMVNDFSFAATDQSLTNPVNLMSANGYSGFELNWTSGRDGKRYVGDYRFNYREVRGTDTTGVISIQQRFGTTVASNSTTAEGMALVLNGELFFSTLANRIPMDPTVDKRIFLGLDFVVSVANDEFHTFLTLSEPVSGIIEDRPSYSNIDNGYGIFAGRYVKYILGKRLNPETLAELVNGNITSQLRFCSAMPLDVNSPFYCGN